jgi:gluconolactonase
MIALLSLVLLAPADAPEKLPPTVAEKAALTVEYEAKGTFFEGPTFDPKSGKLYFTAFTAKNTQVLRLDARGKARVFADKTEGVNGTCLSLDGKLLGAQAFGHRVLSYTIGDDGPTETKVLLYDKALNQPNDLCQAPDGTIYFTDPDFKNRKASAVYRLSKDGKAAKVITDMPVPNGIKTSPDGKTLYISDSHERHWKAYPIKEDGTVGAGKVFFDPGNKDRREPDGMTVDEKGNLYLTGRGGVWVVSPEGKALGLIAIKEFASNACFGGKDGKALFVTCQDRVYCLAMTVRGAQFARKR